MIKSFSCKMTESFFASGIVPRKAGWQSVKKVASRKLDILDAAKSLEDLRIPPKIG